MEPCLRFQKPGPERLVETHPQPWCGKHIVESENVSKNVYNYAAKQTGEKTPMCRIAELARHHKLKHEYILMDESGPAHKKKFTVKLMLTEGEEYTGSGASIKKAQQAAAENALNHTALTKPPRKSHKTKNDTNPVFLLFSVANQLGIQVTVENGTHNADFVRGVKAAQNGVKLPPLMPKRPPFFAHPLMPPYQTLSPVMFNPPPPNHFALMPWSICDGRIPPLNNNLPMQPPPRKDIVHWVCIKLSDNTMHKGSGKTLGYAKNEAATKALFHLRPLLVEHEAKLKQEDNSPPGETDQYSDESGEESEGEDQAENGNDENKESSITEETSQKQEKRRKKKSVVSEIHEAAFRLKMNVEFEVVEESGEPHNRNYVIRCRLTSPRESRVLEADGSGSSKKLAKQNACKAMLDKVSGLENDPVYLASVIVKAQTNKKNNGREAKRKTIVKDVKMDPQYGHHINPISRLIQVMQARKEPDPTFKLVGEQGQNRYREFIVEVKCLDMVETGSGPNKKLAKRAAAVAMLSKIGYVKPMPQPGKSLLKKKSSDSLVSAMSDIGVFDPAAVETTISPPAVAEHAEESSPTQPSVQMEPMVADLVTASYTLVEDSALPAQTRTRADSEKPIPSDLAPIRSQRRRVTFSTQVAECPPPEDSRYPTSSVTLLKSEVVVAPKLKKRGRDSKKCLSAEEKGAVASTCRFFLSHPQSKATRSGLVRTTDTFGLVDASAPIVCADNDYQLFSTPLSPHPLLTNDPFKSKPEVGTSAGSVMVKDAKWLLEGMAKFYKFTVSYSDFPKASNAHDAFFSIVTVGLDKTVLLPGSGPDEEQAHLDAAFHAIESLAQVDNNPSGQ